MGGQRPGGQVGARIDAQAVQPGRGPLEVIGVVRSDPQLDQAPDRRGDEAELAAAVTGGEPAVALVGESDSR
ncbi:MAG: hypothetical protein ACRDPD_20765 [Streptosporangiaceae bacterium]